MARNRQWTSVRVFFSFLMAVVFAWGLVGCGERIETPQIGNTNGASKTQLSGSLSEVAPPPVIQQLSQSLETYQPQVAIASPIADQVLQDTTVSVQFQVQDLPIFKNPDLGLGPHLHVILDNEPYKAVYDLAQPLVFEDVAPGTHTLRVFASRPWHESFKNEGAYAQTTFHIFTKTTDNNPNPALPLLTYSRPTGSYGAEPIMLDFYLTNAPLHIVAQENPDDEIADWRIRVTVNGQSFVLDRWQPIYLKGFKPGKNWVQLEFLDEQGNPVKNVFNDTVRLINYEPKGKDTLAKLVRGELSAEAARGIVPNAKVIPTPIPSPAITPTPIPSPEPVVPEEPELTPEPDTSATPSELPTEAEEPTPTDELVPAEPVPSEKPKSGGFFNRFRRPAAVSIPAPELPEELEAPTPELIVPEEPELTPEPESTVTPSELPTEAEEPTPADEAAHTPPVSVENPKPRGFFGRFRRTVEAPTPLLQQQLPETLEAPSPEPSVVPEQPEQLVIPSEPPATVEEPTTEPEKLEVEPAPVIKPVPVPIEPRGKGFFNRLRSPVPSKAMPDTGLPPTLPEIIETPSPELSEPDLLPTTPPDATPTETTPAASASETPETSSPEVAATAPKLDLKEVFLTPPALSPPLRIIQAPADIKSDIPSRFLKKSVPESPTDVLEPVEAPAADSEAIDVPLEAEETP
ncbi:MAG: hypothetical protein KME25_17070 [Symplocastrum torsivum CPER-KK1]|uniref:FHA domain containing protein n=1 Tax=Symplocastrum torsivum CPER-KK1 TaxID=450513 RepID=A0A951PMY5_9CYAN|nr:hypothetical protein [Symplocastrum torsivum CPER-KK1]